MGIATRMRRQAENAVDELRFKLFRPTTQHELHVVSAFHNARPFIERHLRSVDTQLYERHLLKHVLIDDASTDGTADVIRAWMQRDPHPGRELIQNDHRAGGCANYTHGFRNAAPGKIVLQLDGDDWLADGQVFAYLNMIYHDENVWITYNTWAFPDGRASLNSEKIPRRVISENRLREFRWISSHLHSFRRELFSHVRDDSLIDPETGEFWQSSVDLAHYLPMLELAGKHSKHISRVLYVYNLHENSIISSDRERQSTRERRIRQLPRYPALERLV